MVAVGLSCITFENNHGGYHVPKYPAFQSRKKPKKT